MESFVLKDALVMPFIRQADYAARLPWSYGERRLLDYLIIYIESGHCRFIVNRETYNFYEGDFCLVQPGDLVYLEGLTKTLTPFVHLDFFYFPERRQSFPTSAGMLNLDNYLNLLQPRLNDIIGVDIPVRFCPSQPLLFKNKLLRMIGRWKEGTVIGEIEVQKLGTELFLELMRDFSEIKEEKGPSLSNLDRVLAFISLHMHEPLTVKDMAEQVHLSPSRFSTVFKKKYDDSPYQFLFKLRVERAIEMLKSEPDYTITQIAEFCGFNNIQHFSKAVRDTTGKSPSAFRKNERDSSKTV